MAYFLCNSGSGGSTPIVRQTDYYPFPTMAYLGSYQTMCYGGQDYHVFKLSGGDLEQISEIKVKGRLWVKGGSTHQKKIRLDYAIIAEKPTPSYSKKYWYWDGTSWVQSTNSGGIVGGEVNTNAVGWVNIAEITDNTSSIQYELVNFTIPVDTIVAASKTQGLQIVDFTKGYIGTPNWYGQYEEVIGTESLLIGVSITRMPNTSNGSVKYGFSVDQRQTTLDTRDTSANLEDNPPQIEVVWK